MSLPISVQLAQSLAAAAKALQLADQVKISPSPSPANQVDIRV